MASMCRNSSKHLLAYFRHSTSSYARINNTGKRLLLSESYPCRQEWQKRLASPALNNIDMVDFTLILNDKLQKEGRISAIDVDVLVNKIQEVNIQQLDFVETLLEGFRTSVDAVEVLPSTHHALVRGYIELGRTERLLEILDDKIKYGILPDLYAMAILMDHYIKNNNYKDAAKVAYELMLQEELNHHTTKLLSLYACCMRLQEGLPHEDTPYEPQILDDDDYELVVVDFVTNPWYDDHFDIKNERFLLGKTLMMLGRTQNDIIGNSLQLIGCGLYEKFQEGMSFLQKVVEDKLPITQEALESFNTSLDGCHTRMEDIPKKPHGTEILDDKIYELRITEAEKTTLQEQLKEHLDTAFKQEIVTTDSVKELVTDYVNNNLAQHEQPDIDAQTSLFDEWNNSRQDLIDKQIKLYLQREKLVEIQQTVTELREKEEYLSYFDKNRSIILGSAKVPKRNVRVLTEEDMRVERKGTIKLKLRKEKEDRKKHRLW